MGEIYKVIGLMSGTSLDGVDLAYCHFEHQKEGWQFQILDTETVEYPDDFKERIKNTLNVSGPDLVYLDRDLGSLYGELLIDFIDRYSIEVDFISSHGHTIYHQPESRMTFQAGNGQAIFAKTQLPVIYDFRTQDLLMGGQGAPLVPIGDNLLFNEYSACINLGGIANISFEHDHKRIAFDICSANMPLNIVAGKLGLAYDEDGKIARSGLVSESLLTKLNNLPFFKISGPKSLGYEWVSDNIIPLLEEEGLTVEDELATLVEHTAVQIAQVVDQHDLKGQVLVSGGGALNLYLMERIKSFCKPDFEIEIPDDQLVIYKEALIFGLMGVLKWRGENNILSSVTGASRDHSSGIVLRL